MVSFPLSLFLIPYAIIAAIVVFLGFINLRNLARYRAEDVVSFAAFLTFLLGLAIIAFLSYQYLSPVNWKEVVEINIFKKGF